MKTSSYNKILIIIMTTGICGLAVSTSRAQIGFQAKLRSTPSEISSYSPEEVGMSVSLIPRKYPVLSRSWERKPSLVTSSFNSNSLRFNTGYYGRGRNERKLIPVSVDAWDFLTYRRAEYERTRQQSLSLQRLNTNNRARGRRGLGINVALPKRLDDIFGEGGAGLRVSGFRRITFSGRSQWTDAADNDLFRQNKFPSLNMEQISRFDITGTIGSKIRVKVSQDNKTDIPLANRLEIRYKGDDDDILKTIEAGNTTLNLPNTKFVGYSSRIRGLFGIKAAAQLGGLTITAIASQEKGSSEKASFTANGEEDAKILRDYQYAEVRIFDLGIPSDTVGPLSKALRPGDKITRLHIYELENRKDVLEARDANMWVNPDDISLFSAESVPGLKVMELVDGSPFQFYQDQQKNQHYVVFSSSRSTIRDLGYYMEVERNGQTITYGDISKDTLNLTLLFLHNGSSNPNQETWKQMWRNCYSVPSGVSVDDIGLKILKGLNGTEERKDNLDYQEADGGTYLEILGLDQYRNGSVGDKAPDGKLDDRDDIYRQEWGLIIFPHRTPFSADTTFEDELGIATASLEIAVPSIYEYTSATGKVDRSQYYLQLSTKTRSSIIRLKKANIIEGSEKVRLNGQVLTRDEHYSISYDFGQITLLTPEANDPNADITVDYEYAPFFAVQKKTLLGMRAEYLWSNDFKFGATVLYKSDKAQERKPRVGQETATMTVLDFDMALSFRPKLLTTLVNAIPLIETTTPSSIQISGEVAQSRPNPNVENVAYVDDFESAIEDLSLSTSRVNWQLASRPVQAPFDSERGRMLWHTPQEQVQVNDVYDRQTAQGEGAMRIIRMVFRPNIKDTTVTVTGTGDDTLTVIESITDNPRSTWSGVMRYFGSRVDAKRAQLFEVRAIKSDGFAGKLHFDFGIINEDINGNGVTDSEDREPQDGAVDEDEDVGLDGIVDAAEPLWNAQTNPDPNGDNWFFLGEGKCPLSNGECDAFIRDERWRSNDSLYFEWLNGTEGNRVDVSRLGLPDEEKLSSSGSERNDAYFSYEIDFGNLSSPMYWDSLDVEGTDKVSSRGTWRTYRIPIRDSSYSMQFVSDSTLVPEWSQIKHVRIWWESAPGQITSDTIEVASWYFVQSNWQDSVIFSPLSDQSADDATSLVVASIGEDETPGFKSTPADPYRDPSTNTTEPRKGLLLQYGNLHSGDTCIATKDLIVVDRYSGYRRIEMYVYSDLDQANAGDLKLFFRLGRDADNFYEQQIVVKPTSSLVWDSDNYINIDFNEITGLKDNALKELGPKDQVDISDGNYRVYGRPNINEIRYFAVGLVNLDTSQTSDPMNGQVWLDELRVTDVRRDIGTAGRLSLSAKLADVASVTVNVQSQDPFFRGLSSATRGGSAENLGSGKTSTSYNINASFNFDRFFPPSLGARIPITFGFNKAVTTPLLRTNSDIVLPEETRAEEQSVAESQSFSISESFKKTGNNPLFTMLLNRLSTSFSYRRNLSRSVTRPYNFGENYTVRPAFDFGIKKVPTVPILFWTKPIPILRKLNNTRLSLYPSSWRTTATYSRNLTLSDDINGVRRSSLIRSFRGSMNITYKLFQNLTTSYKYSTKRDLSDDNLVNLSFRNFKLGLETNYSQSFSSNYSPKLTKFLTTKLTYTASYRDDFNHSSSTRQSNMSTNRSINGTFDHLKLLGKGKSGSSSSLRGRRPDYRNQMRNRLKDEEDEKDKEKKKKKKKGSGRPFYDYPLSGIRFLTGWIKPVTYRYNATYNSSLPGVLSRPAWKYRFGFTRDADIETAEDSRSVSAGEGVAYDFGSGFKLLGGISTEVRFKRQIRTDLIRQGARQESVSTSWPDLTIRISKFSSFPLIKNILNKFIDVFSPRTGYKRQTKEDFNLDDNFSIGKSVTVSHNPLLSINFKVMRSLSLSGAYTLSKDTDIRYNHTTGAKDTEKRGSRRGISLSTKYSFSAPGGISIPLFGKLKFKSTMNIEMNVKINSSKSEVAKTSGGFATSVDKSEVSIIPIITYIFSQQIKGGLSGRWQDTSDNKLDRKSHVRELRIWAELRF